MHLVMEELVDSVSHRFFCPCSVLLFDHVGLCLSLVRTIDEVFPHMIGSNAVEVGILCGVL